MALTRNLPTKETASCTSLYSTHILIGTPYDPIRSTSTHTSPNLCSVDNDLRRTAAKTRITAQYRIDRPPTLFIHNVESPCSSGSCKCQLTRVADQTILTTLQKIVVPAGKATPSPPVGPALGARGVKAMDFCKELYVTKFGSRRKVQSAQADQVAMPKLPTYNPWYLHQHQ